MKATVQVLNLHRKLLNHSKALPGSSGQALPEGEMPMSIKICVSYTQEEEKEEVLALLKPIIDSKTKVKCSKGSVFKKVYISKLS